MRTIAEIFRSYAVLDADGRHVNGTDKQTNHNYGDAYTDIVKRAFGPNGFGFSIADQTSRESVKLMMEVGIADGSSLLAWREVFPNALCVGFDIHHSDKAHGDRIEFHRGDATKKEDCDRAAGGRLFDLIVDDATHLLEDVLRTLFWLWPYVRPGGLYVVEDGALQDCHNVLELFPFAQIVNTQGPFGGIEPLVVLRKPT